MICHCNPSCHISRSFRQQTVGHRFALSQSIQQQTTQVAKRSFGALQAEALRNGRIFRATKTVLQGGDDAEGRAAE